LGYFDSDGLKGKTSEQARRVAAARKAKRTGGILMGFGALTFAGGVASIGGSLFVYSLLLAVPTGGLSVLALIGIGLGIVIGAGAIPGGTLMYFEGQDIYRSASRISQSELKRRQETLATAVNWGSFPTGFASMSIGKLVGMSDQKIATMNLIMDFSLWWAGGPIKSIKDVDKILELGRLLWSLPVPKSPQRNVTAKTPWNTAPAPKVTLNKQGGTVLRYEGWHAVLDKKGKVVIKAGRYAPKPLSKSP
jgi:hypothetical protein